MKTRWKLLGLGLLAVLTSVVTAAAFKPPVAKQQEPEPPAEVSFKLVPNKAEQQRPAPIPPDFAKLDVRGTSHTLFVKVTPEGVTLDTRADLVDTRPNVTYVWYANVRENKLPKANSKVLAEKFYGDQRFSVLPAGQLKPTFHELVDMPLPPGKYVASVVLYEVMNGNIAPVLKDIKDGGDGYLLSRQLFEVK